MFNRSDKTKADAALREELQLLPKPQIPAGFTDKVLAGWGESARTRNGSGVGPHRLPRRSVNRRQGWFPPLLSAAAYAGGWLRGNLVSAIIVAAAIGLAASIPGVHDSLQYYMERLRTPSEHYQNLLVKEDDSRRRLERNPESAEAHQELGGVLMEEAGELNGADQEEKQNEAVKEFQEAIKFDDNNWRAHFDLGSISMQQGKEAEAERELRTALRINPKHASAWEDLGIVLRRTGRYKEAVAAFQRAVSLDPSTRSHIDHLKEAQTYLHSTP